MTSLRARTVPLADGPDPRRVAAGDGHLWQSPALSLGGVGEALRLQVDRADPAAAASAVAERLGAIASDDGVRRPGTGVVSMGAWPFDPAVAGELVAPEVVVGRAADGASWATTVLPADAGADRHDAAVAAALARAEAVDPTVAGFSAVEPPSPSGFELTSGRDPTRWCDDVAAARDALRRGSADKVVLAREVLVEADGAIDVATVVERLGRAFPDCLRWSIDGFVGASPELLVSRSDAVVRAHPLAGTAPRSGDPAVDAGLAAALRSSTKNQTEHRHTIDLLHEALLPYCSYLDEEAEPSVVAVANVQHLGTVVEGRLSSPEASAVELVCALHPTPAVCGRPRDAALELIARHEGLDRGRYAGPVGWVDADGNGEWAVAIRSAQLDGPRARCLAGVGVVADSEPLAELAETRAKLQAVLGAIVRP